MSSRFLRAAAVAVLALLFVPAAADAKTEARIRWERMCQIRADKFDLILPEAMRGNGIDMWITVMKEGYRDPLWPDLGHGYVGSTGYVVFTDRGGDRIERVAIGVTGYKIARCGVYDQVMGSADLGRVRAGARSRADRGQHVPQHRGGGRALAHELAASEGDARRALGGSPGLRREADLGLPFPAGGERDRRLRRGRRVVAEDRRARLLERGHHAGHHRARRRRVVDRAATAGERPRQLVRHAVHLHHRSGRHRGHLQRAHHPARRPA